ncbi:MAG: hypothetical protein IJZ90_01360, partial [Clostridia bacterium]|nr:hypothetical protein [Clostridia bacterium]
ITVKDARNAAGALDRESTEKFTEALLLCDSSEILKLTDELFMQGRDPSNFITEVIEIFRNILIILNVRNPGTLICETGEELERIQKLSGLTNAKECILIIRELAALDNTLKWAVQRKILFEAGMLSICDRNWSAENIDFNSRLKFLEERVADLAANGLKFASVVSASGVPASAAMQIQEADFQPVSVTSAENQPDDTNVASSAYDSGDFSDKNAENADELDWKDFIAAISDKKKGGIAGNIKVNSKGYILPGNRLFIVFNSEVMKNLLTKQNCVGMLEECAASAFGRKLKVTITDKKAFAELDTSLPNDENTDNADENDEFSDSVNLLKTLSDENGFKIDGLDE